MYIQALRVRQKVGMKTFPRSILDNALLVFLNRYVSKAIENALGIKMTAKKDARNIFAVSGAKAIGYFTLSKRKVDEAAIDIEMPLLRRDHATAGVTVFFVNRM